ncbi:MAG: type-F conjugative transfer system protein TraW [Rickettsiales bacterium]|jgi:conjugal transfer pilus assembly protein TraW|nr:type-F conjugative transfer system protein TraW [Rickettsiales bacterium]
MKILRKISVLQISVIIGFLGLCVGCKLSGMSIGINKSDSLPYRLFLILNESASYDKDHYVAFHTENKWYNAIFAKQIKGVAGDDIAIKEGQLWVYHRNYSEPIGIIKEYALDGSKLTPIKEGKISDDYFLMIAPHKDSLDSRYEEVGLIHKSSILARVIPLDHNKTLVFVLSIVAYVWLIKKLSSRVKSRYFILLFIGLILMTPNFVLAKDLGVHGQLFEISEPDLIQDIRSKLEQMESSGELNKLEKQWQKIATDRAERPRPVEGYSIASQHKVYYHDPSISVQYDIKDHLGNIIVPKGTTVNPLQHQSLQQDLIFIDADVKEQLNWALADHKKSYAMIILVNGSIMEIMRDHKVRIYFDQNGYLMKTFNIGAVPAKVSQEGDLLRIEELVL